MECYEATKGEGALVYQPLSTGITYQLIPKATADGIPMHTMGYGRTSAANGEVFSHVFNYPGQLLGRRLGRDQLPAGEQRRRSSRARRSRWSITTPPMARSRSARWKSWPKSTALS